MMFKLKNTTKVALALDELVEVADGIGDREHLGLLDASQEAQPLLWVQVLISKVIKALYIWQWQEQ